MAPAILEAPAQIWTFERFMAESPDLTELVDGEIYSVAGVSKRHQAVRRMLEIALVAHCEKTGYGTVQGETFAMRIDERNAPMPDIHVYSESRWGQLHENYTDAPADLAIEVVSPSNRGSDLSRKLDLYERAGVREYWVVDPERRTGVYYRLTESGIFHGFHPDADGRICSQAVTGFIIPEAWLFEPPELTELLSPQI
ncbi:Uma2 family endonuclease [soil metagenome]